jgi:hypothetical protein
LASTNDADLPRRETAAGLVCRKCVWRLTSAKAIEFPLAICSRLCCWLCEGKANLALQNGKMPINQALVSRARLAEFVRRTGGRIRRANFLRALSSRSIRSGRDLLPEIAALARQVANSIGKRPKPRLSVSEIMFWVIFAESLGMGGNRDCFFAAPEPRVRWH